MTRRRSRKRLCCEGKKENARRKAKARGGATWHGWSGRVVWGFNKEQEREHNNSLSLLPCQRVTPSYDPGESVFVCLSLSTWQHQQTTTTAISFSLSIYSFVCPLSLSLSSYLSSPCIHALIPSLPILHFPFSFSCNPGPCCYLIRSPAWYASQFSIFALHLWFWLEFGFWGFVFASCWCSISVGSFGFVLVESLDFQATWPVIVVHACRFSWFNEQDCYLDFVLLSDSTCSSKGLEGFCVSWMCGMLHRLLGVDWRLLWCFLFVMCWDILWLLVHYVCAACFTFDGDCVWLFRFIMINSFYVIVVCLC